MCRTPGMWTSTHTTLNIGRRDSIISRNSFSNRARSSSMSFTPFALVTSLTTGLFAFPNSALAQKTTASTAASSPPATPVLQIDAGKVTGRVSPMLYGLMTEEINYSYEGGIYAELIRTRTFKANAQNPVFWNAVGDAAMALDTN